MTALDIIVLLLLGGGAIFGFLRGFVQEALSMIAWLMMIVAVRIFHAPATAALGEAVGTETCAAVLAFLAIVIVTFALGRWIAKSIGKKSRKSVLGPIDRVLGFGFGIVKGLIAATLIFLLLVMGYEMMFGTGEKRPEWMTASRTYPLLNATSDALSAFVRENRSASDTETESADAP